ncbi:CPBP family intramembrane metalloprotease [Weeksellaceae bacterium KMM 9724]|uniref:CPBP family intramembrane glutamic endopeptidase n=1 Tax=Profundicola chukchiensis TaxID=2961959 RepID=UPI00243F8B22|nr:type II CAAX endopeptidase family protein [Profundicola chukchiensis]MDG4949831.1 CPBP family intramembrane metalloprotease [Profundicola chukchiensis]
MKSNPSRPGLATYFNYQVSIGEAILYFFLTLLIGQIVGGVISAPTYFMKELSHVLLPLSFLLGFGLAALSIMTIKKLRIQELKNFFHTKVQVKHIVMAIALYFSIMPIAEYLAMIVPTEGYPILEDLYKTFESSFAMIFEYKVAAFIMVVILAPILEELIFRGLILRGMLNANISPWVAIFLSSFLFGIAHLNPWQFLGAGMIGLSLGFIYWRTQSLLLVIFLHALNNFIAFVITLKTESLDETIFEPNYLTLGIAIILSVLIAFFFYKHSQDTALNGVDSNDDIQDLESIGEINEH